MSSLLLISILSSSLLVGHRPALRVGPAHGRLGRAPQCMARGFGPVEEQVDVWVDDEDDEQLDPEVMDARRDKMLERWASFVQTGGAKEQQAPVLVEVRDVTGGSGAAADSRDALLARLPAVAHPYFFCSSSKSVCSLPLYFCRVAST